MLHLHSCPGTESLFSPVLGPGTVDSQGQIEFLRCYATLKTKSQTKFYLEFHSSCLESFVKSQEGENEEGSEGELLVKFGETLPKVILEQGIPRGRVAFARPVVPASGRAQSQRPNAERGRSRSKLSLRWFMPRFAAVGMRPRSS
nr:phosphatidylinositol 3,4,5-trisphosphate 5-phosphatase 1-like [Aotus nancymaae]